MAQKLFDKASLVMIPSQYKEGKIYNIKPEDQSSSFEFERGSAATRVNSSGLIEQTGVSSTQLWNDNDVGAVGTGSYSDGIVTMTASTGNDYVVFRSLEDFEASDYYEISFDTVVNSGSFCLLQGNGTAFSPNYLISESGSYSRIVQYTHATSGNLFFWSGNVQSLGIQFDGTISNFSIKKVNIDTPRLDYSGTEPALLLEPQRTNQVTYSIYNSSYYQLRQSTINSNSATAPDGTQTAFELIDNSLQDYHWVYRSAVSATANHRISFFAKANTLTEVWGNGGSGIKAAGFDLSNGTIIREEGGSSPNIENYGNGWYRCSFTADGGGVLITPMKNEDNTYAGSGESLYLWGIQSEEGQSYATSYIPTNGQAETRLADFCENTNITDFKTTDASIFIEFDYDSSKTGGFRAVFSTENSTANNFDLIVLTSTSGGSAFKFDVSGSGISFSTFTPVSGKNKALIKFNRSSGVVKTYLNGNQVDSGTATAIPEIHKIAIGGRINAYSAFNIDRHLGDGVSHFTVFPTELTDQECINLTTI